MMLRGVILLGLLVASTTRSLAQTPAAVHSFVPGSGQSSGQEPEYFPANVLGLPDTTARRTVPAIDPRQIASLGMGGVIVLRFDEPIVDGAGIDFSVFENAFYYSIGPRERLYAEPAEVSVSRDGERFVAFPFDTLTLAGCAGTAPTYGDRNPFDPAISGGDGFDLATLGVDSVRFVRIRDVTQIVAGNPTHPFWDPTLSGFDLDAVVAIPLDVRGAASSPVERAAPRALRIVPNPGTDRVAVGHAEGAALLRVVDARGIVLRLMRPEPAARVTAIDIAGFATGVYAVEVIDGAGRRSAAMLRIAP
jgi:hypothetical protein